MERPVMEVTVTESRMMIQVRTVGVWGGDRPKKQSGHFQNEKPKSANGFTMGLKSLSFSLFSLEKWVSVYLMVYSEEPGS